MKTSQSHAPTTNPQEPLPTAPEPLLSSSSSYPRLLQAQLLPPLPPGPGLFLDVLTGSRKDAIIDETRLAHLLGVENEAIQDMIARGELPVPVLLAGKKVWLTGHIVTHLSKRAVAAQQKLTKKKSTAKSPQQSRKEDILQKVY